jgi:DNA-binding beta-propeller fold protein YncE
MIQATVCALLLMLVLTAGPAAATIECVAGCGAGPENQARGVKFVEPFGVAFDVRGNWYVCEHKGERIVRIDSAGNASVFAGAGKTGYSGDGGPAAQATFFDPHGLVIARDEQLYVADTLNHCIRRIDLKTGKIARLAGTGEAGYFGDGGRALEAAFNGTFAISIDSKGNAVYVADLNNRRIRRVDLNSGIVTTVAGNGEKGVPEDGAEAARSPLFDPRAVAVDSKGLVYVLERGGNALRAVDQKGRIRTLIGPASGAGAPSPGSRVVPDLNGPKHLYVDAKDQVIIADAENHLVRRYDPKTGKTETVAGTGEKGDLIVGDVPLKTQLNRPHGVFVHQSGALYISDSYNHRILKLTGW